MDYESHLKNLATSMVHSGRSVQDVSKLLDMSKGFVRYHLRKEADPTFHSGFLSIGELKFVLFMLYVCLFR